MAQLRKGINCHRRSNWMGVQVWLICHVETFCFSLLLYPSFRFPTTACWESYLCLLLATFCCFCQANSAKMLSGLLEGSECNFSEGCQFLDMHPKLRDDTEVSFLAISVPEDWIKRYGMQITHNEIKSHANVTTNRMTMINCALSNELMYSRLTLSIIRKLGDLFERGAYVTCLVVDTRELTMTQSESDPHRFQFNSLHCMRVDVSWLCSCTRDAVTKFSFIFYKAYTQHTATSLHNDFNTK